VARLQEEARWSSYTASWSRRVTGGPPWVRRSLIAVILLIFISAVIGAVVTIGRGDPIERAYGEAGHQLELAMAQLGDLGIACSTDIVADAGRGGASVGCATQEGVRVALVSFRGQVLRLL